MMTMHHTRGPWECHGRRIVGRVIRADGYYSETLVATLNDGMPTVEASANAALIAAAGLPLPAEVEAALS